jgi:AraC family transcriptional regulator, positive regulator of tynA and feaB
MVAVYSTKDVHPRDSMSYWMDIVAAGFVKLSLTAQRTFNGTVSIGSIGSLGLSAYDTDAHSVSRGKHEISRADTDGYFICLQRTGKSVHFQGDREAIIEGGSFFLLDPRRPFSGSLAEAGKMVSISVPRQEIEARIGPGGTFVSRALNSANPVAGLAYGFLAMLPDRVDTLDETAAPRIVEQALDLVALAFSSESEAGVTLSSPRAAALSMLKAAIESRLHDPSLKPITAAAAAGISVRYANALLAQEETGLEAYIFARRLERCRRALDDPAQARRTIGDIAFSWGFSDLSHFGRRFKAEYGCAPGEYRKQRTA